MTYDLQETNYVALSCYEYKTVYPHTVKIEILVSNYSGFLKFLK